MSIQIQEQLKHERNVANAGQLHRAAYLLATNGSLLSRNNRVKVANLYGAFYEITKHGFPYCLYEFDWEITKIGSVTFPVHSRIFFEDLNYAEGHLKSITISENSNNEPELVLNEKGIKIACEFPLDVDFEKKLLETSYAKKWQNYLHLNE